MCVFCKIIKGEIPSEKVFEDDDCIIIKDINPKAKIHLLLIPKVHYALLNEQTELDAITLGKLLQKFSLMAGDFGLSGGFRVIINQGRDGGQEVGHLHVHILGGEQLRGF